MEGSPSFRVGTEDIPLIGYPQRKTEGTQILTAILTQVFMCGRGFNRGSRLLVAGCILSAPILAAGQTQRAYYTDERLANMHRNVEQHEWARKERDQILERADRWIAYDDEHIRLLIPSPDIPRAYTVHETGCPICGEEAHRRGRYSWHLSPDVPWKIRCSAHGHEFPSNDFVAFRESGMKDRSLLTGDYPDDGWGWRKEGEARKFWLTGYYAHFIMRDYLLPATEDLSKAYLLTGDPRYAHTCAVILWQIAEHYPNYQYETQSRYGTEFDADYKGRLFYHTWEAHHTAKRLPPAYDAIRPAIDDDRALQRLVGRSGAGIRQHIEDRLLRTMARDILRGDRVRGNYGSHQVALLIIAAILNEQEQSPTRQEMIDWVFSNDDADVYVNLGFTHALQNLIHRDGYPFESPGYSAAWVRQLYHIAEAMEQAGVDVFDHPRFRRLFEWPLRMVMAEEFSPALGDSGNMWNLSTKLRPWLLTAGFRRYGDPIYARALVQTGQDPEQNLFSEYLSPAVIQSAAEQHPEPIGTTSEILPGVGIASLQSGNDGNRVGVSAFYGYYVGHRHYDRLHIDLFAHRHSLMPDFGYPETASNFDPRRFGFFAHTVSHNTVMVDARNQAFDWGRLHVFDPGEFAQTLEISAESNYPGVTDLYRRTLILVDAAPDQAYLVDIFRVRGGRQHDWIVHGSEAEFHTDLPLSKPREGTLAGPDVPYGYFYDDPALRDAEPGTLSYSGYSGSGFQWLFNVQEAPRLHRPAVADWRLNRPDDLPPRRSREGIGLRAHLVGRDEQVLVADGKPQLRETWPETVKFLIRRRTGDELESVFVTVFEPYKNNEPFVGSIRPLEIDGDDSALPVALEVLLADGTRQIVFNQMEESPATVSLRDGSMSVDGRTAVFAHGADGAGRAYLLGGREARWGDLVVRGIPSGRAEVVSVDYETGRVKLSRAVFAADRSPPAGGLAIVESDHHEAALPVLEVIDSSTFVTQSDLAGARASVSDVRGDQLALRPAFAYFGRAGMTVVNEAGERLGRVRSISGGKLHLDRDGVTLHDIPDLNDDGRRDISIVPIGPGDRILVHRSNRR